MSSLVVTFSTNNTYIHIYTETNIHCDGGGGSCCCCCARRRAIGDQWWWSLLIWSDDDNDNDELLRSSRDRSPFFLSHIVLASSSPFHFISTQASSWNYTFINFFFSSFVRSIDRSSPYSVSASLHRARLLTNATTFTCSSFVCFALFICPVQITITQQNHISIVIQL